MSHPTLGRLSRRPDNDPQLMKKVKFFACAVSVFVCVMGEGDGISPQNTCIDTVIQKLQISRF